MRFPFTGNVHQLRRKSFIGQMIALVIGVQILFFGAFLCLNLPTPAGKNLRNFTNNVLSQAVSYLPERYALEALARYPQLSEPPRTVRLSLYVPQAPLAVFVGYVLGWQLGAVAAFCYLIFGLAGPYIGVHGFGAGGGLDYYWQPGFGYLLGMVAAAAIAGLLTSRKRTSLMQVLACVVAVAGLHLCGLAYLFGMALVSAVAGTTSPALSWQQWLFEEARNLSWYTLPYDLLFSLAAIGLGFPFRWLVNTLTAPDIAVKPKTQPRLEELL